MLAVEHSKKGGRESEESEDRSSSSKEKGRSEFTFHSLLLSTQLLYLFSFLSFRLLESTDAFARRQARRARRDPRGVVVELFFVEQQERQQQQASAVVQIGAVIGVEIAARLAPSEAVSALSALSSAAAARPLLRFTQGGGQVVGRDRR